MPIYLLTPRHLQAPDWKLSTHRKPVQIEAASEQEARARATLFFSTSTEADRGGPKRFNPWNQATLVRAKVVSEADPGVLFKPSKDAP